MKTTHYCKTYLQFDKLLILFFLFFALSAIAQQRSQNFYIHVQGSQPKLQHTSAEWDKILTKKHQDLGNASYLLLQFEKIPTDNEKQQLANKGVHLLHYIPNFSWITKVNQGVVLESLNSFSLKGFSAINADWKYPLEMKNHFIDNATKQTAVKIIIYEKDLISPFADTLRNCDIDIINIEHNWYNAEINGSEFNLLINHPMVQYIEWQEETPIEETVYLETQITMSAYISDNPGKGLFFRGDNVKIGVNEADAVDNMEDPDYRSRINRDFEVSNIANNHKSNVARRMASAGNINPLDRGPAHGATLYSGGLDFQTAAQDDITLINRSVGWGCPSGASNYNAFAGYQDFLARTYPSFTVSYSAGNVGGSDCYAGFSNWGNITGLNKMAKNIFVVGATDHNGNLTGFSSRGPAKDGRILPHVVASGPGGTSYASPNLGGVYAQLNHAYRFYNGSTIPDAGLIKAVIMNTCDDTENPGPDFKTGFGKVNARRAYEVIENNQILIDNIAQGGANNHQIICPSGAKELKVMLYWTDWEATAGVTSKTLVNDLDLVMITPSGQSILPWVLNPTFDLATINLPAVRFIDTLNNVEQITIKDPLAGVYQLQVSGAIIPQGPQKYYLTYEFVNDEIVITYPNGAEHFVANETEKIRWDAPDSNLVFDLYYSIDNASTWELITAGLPANTRYYDWTVPNKITNEALIKVERGSHSAVSDANFHIYQSVDNLSLVWSCADSSLFTWNEITSADAYIVYRIVGDYMDSVGLATSNSFVLNGLSLTENEYIAVSPIKNGAIGRRAIAITRTPAEINCNQNDISTYALINPGTNHIPQCMADEIQHLEIQVKNFGVNTLYEIPLSYQIDNNPIEHDTLFQTIPTGGVENFIFSSQLLLNNGYQNLKVWTALPNDAMNSNDTIEISINIYNTNLGNTIHLTEDFDDFSNCSTAWGCETISCLLSDDWFNVPNELGDDIDWRTNDFNTGTGNTGPTGDYPTGNGKYLFLEGSGNGGSGCVMHTAILQSPCIDLTQVNSAELSFWYHAYGTNIGELHVDALVNGKLVKDLMPPIIGEKGNQWLQQTVDLSGVTGNLIVIIFRGSTGNGFRSDLALDFINLSTAPIVDFEADEILVCKNQEVSFSNSTQFASQYDWSITPNTFQYIQGTNNNNAEPKVQFQTPGFYTVQLKAMSSNGLTDSLVKVNYIRVIDDGFEWITNDEFCSYDEVYVDVDNNNLPLSVFHNGLEIYNGNNGNAIFVNNPTNNDQLWSTIEVNPTCIVNSDTLTLQITNVENEILTLNDGLLASDTNGLAFIWVECENDFLPIPNEITSYFSPSQSGNYALVSSVNNCYDTTECVWINVENTPPFDGNKVDLVVYPNPNYGTFKIDFGNTQSFAHIRVYNDLGQLVFSEKYKNTLKVDMDLTKMAAGKYIVKVLSEEYIKSIPVVLN